MYEKQRGLTLISFVFVLALIVFAAFIGMRLFPIYQESFAVGNALKGVAAQPGVERESPSEIRSALMRRFDVNYVTSVGAQDIYIDRNNGYNVAIRYEVRKPLIGNLDVVAKFDKKVNLLAQ